MPFTSLKIGSKSSQTSDVHHLPLFRLVLVVLRGIGVAEGALKFVVVVGAEPLAGVEPPAGGLGCPEVGVDPLSNRRF